MRNDIDSSIHWIKLFDKIKQWQHYQESTVLHVFIELLLTANYKDSWWKGHKIKRGELITSVSKISESTGLSHMTIKTALKKLEESKEIKREANNQFTKIIINQFNDYQCELNNSQQGSHKIERVEGIYVIDGVEIEKEMFKEKVSAYISEINSHIDANDFINYYDANGWQVKVKGKMKPMENWKLCVQTWTRIDKKDRPELYAKPAEQDKPKEKWQTAHIEPMKPRKEVVWQ